MKPSTKVQLETEPTNKDRISLIKDLTLKLVLTVILATLFSLVLNLFFIHQKTRAEYEEQKQALAKNMQENLELPLWNFDEKSVGKIAGIYLENAGITYLKIIDSFGKVLYENGKHPRKLDHLTTLDIHYNDEVVGNAALLFHQSPYRKNILQLLYVQILTGLLVTLTLVIAIISLTKRILNRPLSLLLNNIDRIASGDYVITKENFKHKEINAIVDAFSKMTGIIQTREQELKESGERYRSLYENVPVGLFRASLDGTVLSANRALLEMFDMEKPSELTIFNRVHGAAHAQTDWFKGQSTKPSEALPEELQLYKKDGTRFWAKLQAREIMTLEGEKHLDGFILDITPRKIAETALKDREEKLTRINRDLNVEIVKRKATEHALRNSERRMAQIINFMPDPMFAIDNSGRILFWNQALEKLTGVSSESMVGKNNHEYAIPFYGERKPILIDLVKQWDEAVAENYVSIKQMDGILVAESRNVPFIKGDSWFWNAACPLLDVQGRTIGAIETIRNITELKRTEKELRETGDRFRTLFESASDAILILDNTKVIDCNLKALEMFDYSRDEILGINISTLSPPTQPNGKPSNEEALRHLESLKENPSQMFEWRHKNRSGLLIDTEVSLTPIKLDSGIFTQAIIRDITERKRTRELMIQTEKMMSLGGLAAGMAHEINNPLGIILQSVQNTARRLGRDLPANQAVASELGLDLDLLQEYLRRRAIDIYLTSMKDAGERAAKIVRTMLDFSRKSESRRAMHQIDDILNSVLEMASNDYDLKKTYDFRSITIVKDYQSSKQIPCTETEIAQVFFNIIKNAGQAISEKTRSSQEPPRLTIRTRDQKNGIKVEIEDNGPGIDEAFQKTIFEPFFTTKPVGEGTGLGLSVSYFIVTKNHKGTMTVNSEPGKGTCFIIELPDENWRTT